MKSITVDISEELAKKILPILEQERDSLDLQIRRIKSAISASNNISDGSHTQVLPLAAPAKGPSGLRAKRGASRGTIIDFLKSKNGNLVAAKEISAQTGTAYGSCVRILRELKASGIAKSDNRLWVWSGKGFAG